MRSTEIFLDEVIAMRAVRDKLRVSGFRIDGLDKEELALLDKYLPIDVTGWLIDRVLAVEKDLVEARNSVGELAQKSLELAYKLEQLGVKHPMGTIKVQGAGALDPQAVIADIGLPGPARCRNCGNTGIDMFGLSCPHGAGPYQPVTGLVDADGKVC